MKIIDRLFVVQAWDIGYSFSKITTPTELKNAQFRIIKSTRKEWYADPFCVQDNDNYYIFCESFDLKKGKGRIGVFDYKKDSFSKCNIIIDEPFHMSYPNVFKIKDNWYMIPEICESSELRLYKAESFPYKWSLLKVLMKGVKYVDSTFCTSKGRTELLCYDISNKPFKLKKYAIDYNTWDLTFLNEISDFSMVYRPGGNSTDGFFISQYNQNYYGQGLVFTKDPFLSRLSSDYQLISTENIACGKKYFGIHTLNSSLSFSTIDLLHKKICLSKPFFALFRRKKQNV